MPTLWQESRPPGAPPRGRRDWLLAGVVCLLGVLEGLTRPGLPGGVVAVLLVIATAPTLLFRRSRPLAAVTLAFTATALAPLLTGGVPPEGYALVYLLLLPYALLRWGSGHQIVLGVAVIVAKSTFSLVAGHMPLGTVLAGGVVTFGVAALGAAARYRAAGRARELDRIRLLERERLARDLHDTVAHHVSAMAIRAQAGLAVAATDPAAALDALRVIEAEAARALAEMRTMVRVLRSDDQPGLADLDRLADGRPPVELGVEGDLAGVAPAVGAAIFRLAQEAVTNARRHARHATRIEVRVAADDAAVHLRVSDDGEPPPAAAGGGFGLSGMRERAALLGGVCTAGPAGGRGWNVTATLPLRGPADRPRH